MADAVRPVFATLSALLSTESGQQAFRAASAALVRPEPPGRRFRRNLCGMAAAALELALALRRRAGAEEAGICRRVDDRNRWATAAAHRSGAGRSPEPPHRDAWRALQEKTGS